MHCNHSKSFHHNLISIQDRVQHPRAAFWLLSLLTQLTGGACEGSEVTLAGGDIVPGYNTISTMGTLSTLAGGGLPTICQQKGLLAGLGQLYFAHLMNIF